MQLFPKKRLSQNFLTDTNILKKIVAASGITQNDVVVEIGCGRGSLTEWILAAHCQLYGVEYDAHLIPLLKDRFIDEKHFTLFESDILKFDMDRIPGTAKIKIIGNLPYHISSPILFKLFDHGDRIDTATVMLQKEVAQRLVSAPRTKDYGILAVFVQFHCDCRKLFDIPPSAFFPKPKVESSIVQLQFRDPPAKPDNYDLFKRIVKRSFNQRRKMLRNSLSEFLRGLQIEFNFEKRPEELSVQDFVVLSNLIGRASNPAKRS